jgi:hypothetical protein
MSGYVFCSWNTVPRHEILRESLAGFKTGGIAARPDYPQPAAFKFVDNTEGERDLAANEGKFNGVRHCKISESRDVVRPNGDTFCDLGDPRVPISAKYLGNTRASRKCVAYCVFPPARADYQNSHRFFLDFGQLLYNLISAKAKIMSG